MDELRIKIKRFREAHHEPGSVLMIELMREVVAAFDAMRHVDLGPREARAGTIKFLSHVQGMKEAFEREDYGAIGKSITFYGILADGK